MTTPIGKTNVHAWLGYTRMRQLWLCSPTIHKCHESFLNGTKNLAPSPLSLPLHIPNNQHQFVSAMYQLRGCMRSFSHFMALATRWTTVAGHCKNVSLLHVSLYSPSPRPSFSGPVRLNKCVMAAMRIHLTTLSHHSSLWTLPRMRSHYGTIG